MKTCLPQIPFILLAISVGVLQGAEKTAVPFRDLSFAAASKAAESEGKLVFIDFFTTWCGPCKQLDAQTWNDPVVGKLVGEKAVALKIDAEKQPDLAARYRIDAYPTMLLLKTDGTEVDRLVGFREAAQFIAEFNSALAGKTSLDRARDAIVQAKAGHEAVQARYDLGRELARNSKNAEALAEFLWCFDEGMVKETSFYGTRVSFLLADITRLSSKYPAARAALIERRDAAQERLLAAASDHGAAQDFASLNQTLQDDARTLEVFDRLPAGDPRRKEMGYSALQLLLKRQRYSDALAIHPYGEIAQQFEQFKIMADRPGTEMLKQAQHQLVISSAADSIEILIGAGDFEHARELAGRLFNLDGSDESRTLIRSRALRAGHPEIFPAGASPETGASSPPHQ
jgi:thiol-disulfide isomerase/thioredoxin